jgi:hypothetical protein
MKSERERFTENNDPILWNPTRFPATCQYFFGGRFRSRPRPKWKEDLSPCSNNICCLLVLFHWMLMKMNARMWHVRANHALMISDRIAISRLLRASNIRYAISTNQSIPEIDRTVWATNRNSEINRDRIMTMDSQNEIDISEIEFADKYVWKNRALGLDLLREQIWCKDQTAINLEYQREARVKDNSMHPAEFVKHVRCKGGCFAD